MFERPATDADARARASRSCARPTGSTAPSARRRARRSDRARCSACSATCRPGSATRAIAGQRIRPLLSAGFAAEFAGRDPYQMFLNRLDLPEGAPRDPLNQSMWLWLKSMFPNKLLNFLGDRMEMAHSIEGRTPFLDHHLVEAGLPDAGRDEDARHDREVRAARGREAVPHRHRLQAPEAPVHGAPGAARRACASWCATRSRGPALEALPFFDPAAVRRFVATEPARRPGRARPLLRHAGSCS